MVDDRNLRHVLWHKDTAPGTSSFPLILFYSFSLDAQHWSTPRDLFGITAFLGSHQMVVDSQGTLHVVWIQYKDVDEGTPPGVYYTWGRKNAWAEPQLIFKNLSDKKYGNVRLAVDSQDRLHLVMKERLGFPGTLRSYQITYCWKDVSSRVKLKETACSDKPFIYIKNYPNPFNETTLFLLLPHTKCSASLEIYNITGQRIKTLLKDTLVEGEMRIAWDGRDGEGRPLASGIYFYRLEASQATTHRSITLSGKLILLR